MPTFKLYKGKIDLILTLLFSGYYSHGTLSHRISTPTSQTGTGLGNYDRPITMMGNLAQSYQQQQQHFGVSLAIETSLNIIRNLVQCILARLQILHGVHFFFFLFVCFTKKSTTSVEFTGL